MLEYLLCNKYRKTTLCAKYLLWSSQDSNLHEVILFFRNTCYYLQPLQGCVYPISPEDHLLSRRDSNPYYAPSEGVVLPLHHETISRNKAINQIITLLGVRGESNPRIRDSQSRTDYQHLQLTQSEWRDSNLRTRASKAR